MNKPFTLFSKFFTLIILFSLLACYSDDETPTIESSKKENLMLHKNASFLEKNEEVNSIINEINNLQKFNKSSKSSNDSDFIIHKENITYIRTPDGERESFTFFVEKNYKRNLNFVENLVLSKKINSNQFNAVLITYYFPDGYKVENKDFQVIETVPITNIENFVLFNENKAARSSGCQVDLVETKHSCYSGHHSGAGEAAQCDHKGQGPYSTYNLYLSCSGSGGGGGGQESNPGGQSGSQTGNGGPGGNNGNSGANNGIDTGITLPPSCQGTECNEVIVPNNINILLNKKLSFSELIFLYNNESIANKIQTELKNNQQYNHDNYLWAINYLTNNIDAGLYFSQNPQDLSILFALGTDFFNQNPNISWEELKYLLHNKTSYESTLGDLDNNVIGGYDNTIYSTFDFQTQGWPNINPIISKNDFIGWGYPNIKRNCMDYAKAQIAIKGYAISNYSDSGQTFQIYTSNNGVNSTELSKGVSYLKYALTNNIPVIVGVDFESGSPNPSTDNTTDHFVVIVGMGSDSKGMYLIFYDNAVSDPNGGANANNRLYYNSTTKKFQGQSQSTYGVDKIYTITMIRKSKKK